MIKKKMLSLALAMALIMSLVPVSGFAAETSVPVENSMEVQEDTLDEVLSEGRTEGTDDDFAVFSEMGTDEEGDQEIPQASERDGIEQATESADKEQVLEDVQAEEFSVENESGTAEGSSSEELTSGDVLTQDEQNETVSDPVETVVSEEAEQAADTVDEETAVEETVAEDGAQDVVSGQESSPEYVLMNIPYADFYAAELAAGSAAVDAVASATKSKTRSGLAAGSYHVNSDGSDISGVVYPVKVGEGFQLDPAKEITDESSLEITVKLRGQDVTTTYTGKEALFEAADYSWYALSEAPAYYKEVTVSEGVSSFGAVQGEVTDASAQVEITANGGHTYYEMTVTADGIAAGDKVSGVVMTMEDGSTYGLKHVVNIWRGTELGFDADETYSALIGKKITGIKYIKEDAIYNYAVDVTIPEKLPEYVLMNIPYADFYAAELASGSAAVDAVASATMSKPRSGLAAGSYHVNSDGSDISGVVYPVKVGKGFQLDPAKEITDESSLEITVKLRGQDVTTTYTGKEALFEAADYSWYDLSNADAPTYFKEAKSHHGMTSFGAVQGEVTTGTATAEVKAKGRHTEYEIVLTSDALSQENDVVSAVVVTDADGKTYGLRHLVNIWRVTELGFNRDEALGVLAGKKITGIKYIKQNGIVNLTVDIDLPVLASAVTLDKTTASVLLGKTLTLKATVDPAEAAQSVTWASSNEAIAKVDANGLVTPVAVGTATITATASDGTGVAAECAVTVKKPVEKAVFDKETLTLMKGKSATLKLTVTPSDASDTSVTWKSGNTKVATVTQKGVVKAVGKGTCSIVAIAKDGSGKKAVCKVTVKQPVTKITFNKTTLTLMKGKSATLKATVAPSNANLKTVTWKSGNTKVATVTQKGVVKAVGKGTCSIVAVAKDGSGKKAVCKVTVKQPVTKITLSKTKLVLKKGKSATLKATVAPSNANLKTVTWKSSNTKVVTVTQKGVVKAVKKGTATITVTAKDGSGKKATCVITVQ